jgi:hypothetical protein
VEGEAAIGKVSSPATSIGVFASMQAEAGELGHIEAWDLTGELPQQRSAMAVDIYKVECRCALFPTGYGPTMAVSRH